MNYELGISGQQSAISSQKEKTQSGQQSAVSSQQSELIGGISQTPPTPSYKEGGRQQEKAESRKLKAESSVKMCPLLSINFVPSQRSMDWWEIAACKEDQCAWWDQHGKRCYIKTLSLAIASEVRSNLAERVQKGVEL